MLRFVESYPLVPESVVFDIGGYTGEWAMRIWHKYGCTIEIFEPIDEFLKILRAKFALARNVHINAFGLGAQDKTVRFNLAGDATSAHLEVGTKSASFVVRGFRDVWMEKGYRSIDLMAVNIEGGEYDLLDSLIAEDLHVNIRNILVQFHDSMPEAFDRRKLIQEKLRKTHVMTMCYEMVWENWRLA